MPTPEALGAGPLPVRQPAMDRTQADPTPAPSPKPKDDKAVRQFTLGEGFAIIPAKLVTKILKGDYVDMADLLAHKIKLEENAAADGTGRDSTSKSHGKKRELLDDVNGLFSWVEAFNSFVCILTDRFPGLRGPSRPTKP